MKTYKCESCGRVIENPFEEKMKEFYYGVEADVFGVFPIPWKEKKKIHLCEKCFEGLAKIKYAGEKVSNNVIEIPEGGIGNLSDGYHTFNELYHHRAILFSVICNSMPDKAWKSKLHDTGDMYDGMFIVGIETPEGQATYHYDIEPYWDMFKVKELEKAPKWDGHTPQDAIERISKLSADVVEVVRCGNCRYFQSDDDKRPGFCTNPRIAVVESCRPQRLSCPLMPRDGFCSKGEEKYTE